MNEWLTVHVAEFQNNEEKMVGPESVDVTTYEDGSVEFGVTISGKEHRVYIRFMVPEVVRIALTSESREEAP